MLKFYYSRLSINARRVWVTLLEKKLEFESILLKLNGDQFQPSFLELNPFLSNLFFAEVPLPVQKITFWSI